MLEHEALQSPSPGIRPDLARQLPVLLSIKNPTVLRRPAEDVRIHTGPKYIIRDSRDSPRGENSPSLRCMDEPVFITNGPHRRPPKRESRAQEHGVPTISVRTPRIGDVDAAAVDIAIGEIVKRLEPFTR